MESTTFGTVSEGICYLRRSFSSIRRKKKTPSAKDYLKVETGVNVTPPRSHRPLSVVRSNPINGNFGDRQVDYPVFVT